MDFQDPGFSDTVAECQGDTNKAVLICDLIMDKILDVYYQNLARTRGVCSPFTNVPRPSLLNWTLGFSWDCTSYSVGWQRPFLSSLSQWPG